MSELSREAPAAPAFQQRLGLFDATMLVVGTMIGSGIFVVSAGIARDVNGPGWLMAVWALTGVMTIIGALSYAELAAMMPHAGGQYVYLREAFGSLPGFLYGWTCFLVIQTGSIAAVAVVFAKYLGVFVPRLRLPLWEAKGVNWELTLPLPWRADPLTIFKRADFAITYGQLVAVAVIVVLTLLNCRGVREGKWVQNLMTGAKVLALGLLIILGLTLAVDSRAVEANTTDSFAGIEQSQRYQELRKDIPEDGLKWLVIVMVAGATMTGSLFAADAWNNITFTAGEIVNPRRNLALSLMLGTGTVIFLYLLANLAYLAVLPARGNPELDAQLKAFDERLAKIDQDKRPEEYELVKQAREAFAKATIFERGIAYVEEERVGTAVLERVTPLAVFLMAAAIMISTFGCVNGMILMGARLYYAMAQDRLLFRSVGILNGRGVPAIGLVLQGLWSILLVFSGTYDELLDFVMFTVLVFYVLTVVGLFVLRRKQPNAERPYKAFGYPLIPALYVFLCAAISVILLVVKPENTWPGLILTLAGIPVYFVWRWAYPRTTT